ncbi:MAG: tyrosine-type recombinase/integrase [Anaerolineales bacterium]|nr:tyrosine-type recombinase/integrase [Anaerolineales bacterium]
MNEKPLTQAQVEALYEACATDLNGQRTRLLVTLLLNCGLSEAEAADLRFNHIDYERRWLAVSAGLRRPRFVPLNTRVANALRQWQDNPDAPQTFVLGELPHGRRQRKVRAIHQDLETLAARAGIPFSAAIARLTLAKFLFDHSDDGRLIHDVIPAEKRATATLPLEHLPPFSVAHVASEMLVASKGFIPGPWEFNAPPPETEAISDGRTMLERIGQYL